MKEPTVSAMGKGEIPSTTKSRIFCISGCSNPLSYPKISTRKRVIAVIILVWFVSLSISVPPVLGWRNTEFYQPGRLCNVYYNL